MKLNTERSFHAGAACACCGETAFTPWMTVPDTADRQREYRLVRCPACAHIWLADPPAPDELQQFYGPAYHRAISNSGDKDPVRWGRQLEIISQYKSGGSVLDIGCSSGGFLACLKDGPWDLSGIEASPETAEKARSATGGNIFCGDVIDADFAPSSFDVITCSDVMEHLYDPRLVFQMVEKWLKPGGIFYVFVPNIMSWEARLFRTHWFGLDLPRHLHHYSIVSLSALGRSAGLRQVRMVTPTGCYLEQSTSLWLNEAFRKAGAKNVQVNLSGPGPFVWRVLRKGIRVTLETAYSKLASSCGAGPSLQAVFQKPVQPTPVQNDSQMPGRLAEGETITHETQEVGF